MSGRSAEQQREEAIRGRVAALSDGLRKQYFSQMRHLVKDPDSYAVLNYLFVAGLHHFYLGKWLRGAVNLAVFCAAMFFALLQFYVLSAVLLLFVSLVELPALFCAQSIVMKHNNDISENIIKTLTE